MNIRPVGTGRPGALPDRRPSTREDSPFHAVLLILILTSVACSSASPAQADAPTEELPAYAQFDFRQIVREAKDQVFPAVVYIKCIREGHEEGKKKAQEVGGSGVILTPDGQVVSNWHVVDKAIDVRCLLLDGRGLSAKVLGTDKDTDLALLQLELPEDAAPLPCARLGDSSALVEGDFVMAMGAPWGMSRSVSIGIVSSTRRYLPGNSEYSLWLQTDASISPGNSGGPLVNTAGEVIGVNTRGISFAGDIGFAVPSNTVQRVVGQLQQSERVNWSWTGLQLQPLKDFERNIYFDAEEGVIVAGTDPDSPAANAGIEPEDRIVRLNGTKTTARIEEDLPAIRRLLGELPLDTAATLEIVRADKPMTLTMTPREKGAVEGEELDCPRWDLTVKTINQFDNPNLYFYRTEGVFILGVEFPGNAAVSGLRPDDIILKIGEQEVKTLPEVKEVYDEAIARIDEDTRIMFTVLRNGLLRLVVLDFARDFEKE
jgi:serine protease Do